MRILTHKNFNTFVISALVVAALLGSALVYARTPKIVELPHPIQISRDASQGGYLEVPLVSYELEGMTSSVLVDFVGAVHLGELEYYADLNERFKAYDVVLFELVGDGSRVRELKTAGQDSILGQVQRKLCELLGLQFQLDEIDYSANNFVHADMTAEQLSRAMAARGESLPSMILKLLQASFDPKLQAALQEQTKGQPEIGTAELMQMIMFGPTQRQQTVLKRSMANGLTASKELLTALEGSTGTSLINDRNETALQVLDREVAGGKRKIAIFYGAGHLPDMHKQLVKRKFRMTGVEWLRAWKL